MCLLFVTCCIDIVLIVTLIIRLVGLMLLSVLVIYGFLVAWCCLDC